MHCNGPPSFHLDGHIRCVFLHLSPHRHIRDYVERGCTAEAASSLPPIPVTVARFGVGDAFVFRPDLIHAGDAYDEENVRSHCYLDTATLPGFTRRTNGTFIPSDVIASKDYVALAPLFLPHPDDSSRFSEVPLTLARHAQLPPPLVRSAPVDHFANDAGRPAMCDLKIPDAPVTACAKDETDTHHFGPTLHQPPPPRVARYFGDPASVFCEPDCHYRAKNSDYFCCV
jgi:hypothetical protein